MSAIVPQLAVVGVSLIGASLALAAKRAGAVDRVVGVGRSRANLDRAQALGAIDEAATELTAIDGADLVVLAAPVETCASLLGPVCAAAPGALVSDVASVKGPLCRRATELGVGQRFVGAHPIAGSHRRGAESADEELFRGRTTVLTPASDTPQDAVERVAALWRAVGSEVVVMDAEAHDRSAALTSHLPQMVVYALAASIERAGAEASAHTVGAGLRDSTRLAASSAEVWSEIAAANREPLLAALGDFEREIAALRAAVQSGDDEALGDLVALAQRLRRRIEP